MSSAVRRCALRKRLSPAVSGVGEHRAFRILNPHRPEFHAASPFGWRSLDMPRERNARTICANTATAISAGLAAPMSRPIGAAMRSIVFRRRA